MGDFRGIPPLGVEHTLCTLFPKASRARSISVAFSERVEGLIEAASLRGEVEGAGAPGVAGASGLDGLLGFPAPGMAAGSRVAEVLAQPGNHGVDHARITRVGGAVVEVNWEMRCGVHA